MGAKHPTLRIAKYLRQVFSVDQPLLILCVAFQLQSGKFEMKHWETSWFSTVHVHDVDITFIIASYFTSQGRHFA